MRRQTMVKGWTGALVTISFVGALFGSGCNQEAIPGQTPAGAPGGTRIQVAEVRRGSLAPRVLFSGNVQARQQVTVAPRAAGRIVSLPVDVGSVVRTGDALVELDRATQAAQLAQAQGALDAAEARLRSLEAGPRAEQVGVAEANLRRAEARLAQLQAGPTSTQVAGSEAGVRAAEQRMNVTQARYSALLGSRGSSLTEAQRDADLGVNWEQMKIAEANLAILNAGSTAEQIAEAQAAVDAAREQLALAREPATQYDIRAARASAAQAKAALDVAQAQLGETTIRAPFDGVVAQRLLAGLQRCEASLLHANH
ncbi:MAG: biotin/lipoyl-binding protein [Chloroflexi bacterium]|nr:biotin/lipoyl-binding protein [Chloroflexota bacterium]